MVKWLGCVVKDGEVVGLCSEGVVKGWSRISQEWSRVGQMVVKD